MRNKTILVLYFLSLLGVFFSGITIYDHYSSDPSDVCITGSGCDAANNSKYSEFMEYLWDFLEYFGLFCYHNKIQ